MRIAPHDDRGAAVLEALTMLPYLLLAAVAGWQMMLVATTATLAESAARTGGRVAGGGGDGVAAATDALPDFLTRGAVEVRQQSPESRCGATGARDAPSEPVDSSPPDCRTADVGVGSDGAISVTVATPIIMPGLTVDAVRVTRTAVFPTTGNTRGET